jgi:hypothetical protein
MLKHPDLYDNRICQKSPEFIEREPKRLEIARESALSPPASYLRFEFAFDATTVLFFRQLVELVLVWPLANDFRFDDLVGLRWVGFVHCRSPLQVA